MEKVNLKKWTFSTEGQADAQDATHIYERVQTGSGAVGEKQPQTVGPNCPRSRNCRQHASPLAPALRRCRRASFSRQRASDGGSRGDPAVEARGGNPAPGAGHSKKSAGHLL